MEKGPARARAEQLDAADGLAPFRGRFAVGGGDRRIYLDGNSLGRPPRAVRERLAAAVDEWADRLVLGWDAWIDLPRRVGDRLGAALLGAAPGQVVLSDSTTVNLYKLAAAALAARPGRRAIVGDRNDFPTDRYVLESLAAAHGRELRLIDSDPVEGPDPVAVADAAGDAAVVCLSHVNYRSSARADMAAVTRAIHRAGAPALWDLSHSAGAVPVRLDDDGADLAAGCTYKYLNAGPGAPAYLYVRRELQAVLRQPVWGWFGQRDQFAMGPGYDPEPDVRRFLTGTPPVLGAVAVDAGLDVLTDAGIDRLSAKGDALCRLVVVLHDAWLAPLGCRLASPRDPARRGGHVAIAHDDARRLCAALIGEAGVVVDFREPDVIRLAPAPAYTQFVDVWDACDRIRALLAGDRLAGDRLAGEPVSTRCPSSP